MKTLTVVQTREEGFEVGGVSAGWKSRLAATLQKTFLQKINQTCGKRFYQLGGRLEFN